MPTPRSPTIAERPVEEIVARRSEPNSSGDESEDVTPLNKALSDGEEPEAADLPMRFVLAMPGISRRTNCTTRAPDPSPTPQSAAPSPLVTPRKDVVDEDEPMPVSVI